MADKSPPASQVIDLGRTVGLVLAAGSGTRFGGPKAPFVYEQERLVDRSVRLLHESGIPNVYVVLGAWIGLVPNAAVINNPDFESGMASSIRAGLEHLLNETPSIDRVVITLVDHIGLTTPALIELLSHEGRLIQSTYKNQIGHPVVIGNEHWQPLIKELTGDIGAKNYLRAQGAFQVDLSELATETDLDLRP